MRTMSTARRQRESRALREMNRENADVPLAPPKTQQVYDDSAFGEQFKQQLIQCGMSVTAAEHMVRLYNTPGMTKEKALSEAVRLARNGEIKLIQGGETKMGHNFKTLHEANEFVRKHGYGALDAEDATRIKELKESGRHMTEIIESDPVAIRRQIQTVSEAIGPIRRLKISESERFSRIKAAEEEIKRLEKKLTGADDKEMKEVLMSAGFSEAAANSVVSESDDSAFNTFKQEALRQGKTEQQATAYANGCIGNDTEGRSYPSGNPTRAEANYNNFLMGN